jgi:hypothetical protein
MNQLLPEKGHWSRGNHFFWTVTDMFVLLYYLVSKSSGLPWLLNESIRFDLRMKPCNDSIQSEDPRYKYTCQPTIPVRVQKSHVRTTDYCGTLKSFI